MTSIVIIIIIIIPDCHAPKNISNGIVDFAMGTEYATTALYKCNSGFEFNTSLVEQSVSCKESGNWEPLVHNCTGCTKFFSYPVIYFFRSPEHSVLKVSFSGRQMSVMRHQRLPYGHCRGHRSCAIDLFSMFVWKKTSDVLEFGSPRVITLYQKTYKCAQYDLSCRRALKHHLFILYQTTCFKLVQTESICRRQNKCESKICNLLWKE